MTRSFAVAPGFFVVLSVVAASATDCAQDGPGSRGVISLGPKVDASVFQSLALRAFPNPSGSFDPAQPLPRVTLALDQPVADVIFPHAYSLGAGTEQTEIASWQLVAWLSHRKGDQVGGIDAGDIYCAVPFETDDCGRATNSCLLTPYVDCILGTVAP